MGLFSFVTDAGAKLGGAVFDALNEEEDINRKKRQKSKKRMVLDSEDDDAEEQHEQIRLWIHNYITTAATFLQYSLVAAITADGEPSSSVLL